MISLSISTQAHDAIVALAAESADGLETGGILLGRGPDGDGGLVVERAGDAGPDAVRRRDYFMRDNEHARALAASAWEDHEFIWVGEWHTHPHGDPAPSSLDVDTYVKHLTDNDLNFTAFVSIVVIPGVDGNWQEPRLNSYILYVTDPRSIEEPISKEQ